MAPGLTCDRDEDRFIAISPIERRLIVVVSTERLEDIVRIISVRMETRRETELFLEYRSSGHV